jgi:myo-inositol catabolism protein IolS
MAALGKRKLGRAEVGVSEVGLGTWAMGGDEWGVVEDKESIRAIQRALDLGVNFLDTADVYGSGHSEELIARAVAGVPRDRYVLSSKAGFDIYSEPGTPGGAGQDFTAPYLRRALDESLKRLKTDHIDVYHLHNPSLEVIYQGDALDTLVEQRDAGKIRFIAVSVSNPEEGIACINTGVVDALQLVYNLLNRGPEAELLPMASKHKIGIIVRSPLAFGLLTGKYKASHLFPNGDFRSEMPPGWLQGNVHEVDQLRFLANSGRTLAQAAIAFVLSNPVVSVVIPGAKTVSNVEENVSAANFAPLDQNDRNRLGEIRAARQQQRA